MVVRYHPRYGHLFVPGVNARIPHERGGYLVRTNSSGFRSDVEFVKKRGEQPRILVFGDSQTAGDGVNNEERFSDLLGEELGVEVYNYAISGSAPDQHLMMYEDLGSKIEADLIVWGIYLNNIERIQLTHRPSIDRSSGKQILVPKPYFTLDNGNLKLHHVPVPRERPDLSEEEEKENIQEFEPPLLERLYLHPWFRPFRTLIGTHLRDLKDELRSMTYRFTGVQMHEDYCHPEGPGWQLMAAFIRRFHELVEIPLLVVPLPTYHYYVDRLEPIYQELYDSLADSQNGLHVYDLTGDLVQTKLKQRKQGFTEGHYSPSGHQQIARLIAREIRKRDLLPKESLKNTPSPVKPAPVKKPNYILGISCFSQNSAAALIKDGKIIAAAEEERFSRVKNDSRFPHRAINYCLEEARISQHALTAVVYSKNLPMMFERIVHSLLATRDEAAWMHEIPAWIEHRLHIPRLICHYLKYDGLVLQSTHLRSQCSSAYYPSPYEEAAILTVDGVGEWSTASIGKGKGNHLELLREMRFPHSLGLFYAAFDQFIGFKDEYQMMGLAPYGEPKYVETILNKLLDIKEDGSIELNLDYFSFFANSEETNEKFATLFGGPAREPNATITRREADIARSVQAVVEETMLRMARYAHKLTGDKKLCISGSMALNCIANGRLSREGPFEEIWMQPAAHDAGCALGAAFDAYHTYFDNPRVQKRDHLQHTTYLGPDFPDQEICSFLDTHDYPYQKLDGKERAENIAELLVEGKVIGHFAGRMEFGPQVLGSRSIIGDARNQEIRARLNMETKSNGSFRPATSTVLRESASKYQLDHESPFMLLYVPLKEERRLPSEQRESSNLLNSVHEPRSNVPAVTDGNYSALVQTVERRHHPLYYDFIKKFEEKTGYSIIANISFNIHGEPVVCTPFDAYRCFMLTKIDVLIMGNYMLFKKDQPNWQECKKHRKVDGAPMQDTPFLQELHKLYEQKFLPLSLSLQSANEIEIRQIFKTAPSQWKTFVHLPLSFKTPTKMNCEKQNPGRMANTITSHWHPGPITKNFNPILANLLKLGARFDFRLTIDVLSS